MCDSIRTLPNYMTSSAMIDGHGDEIFHKPYIGINPRPLFTSDAQFSICLCLLVECLCVMSVFFPVLLEIFLLALL